MKGGLLRVFCPKCAREYVPDLAQPQYAEAYAAWRGGLHAQAAFHGSTAVQREQLISGTCSQACWDGIFWHPEYEDEELDMDEDLDCEEGSDEQPDGMDALRSMFTKRGPKP